MTDTLYALAALASAVAAVLAWVAKVWWGREYGAAKDEIIHAKDSQIESLRQQLEHLRELTPMRIKEYFVSVKEQLEEYNDALHTEVKEARSEIERKEAEIAELRSAGDTQSSRIAELQRERDELKDAANDLDSRLKRLTAQYKGAGVLRMPPIDTRAMEDFQRSLVSLRNLTAHRLRPPDCDPLRGYFKAQEEIRRYLRLVEPTESHQEEEGSEPSATRDPDDQDTHPGSKEVDE